MVSSGLRQRVRANPGRVTAGLSVIGYGLVAGAFAGVLPIFPALADETVLLFGDLIAIVNSVALLALLAGVWFIRRGDIRRHRVAMVTAFSLILLFLVLYLWKVGGGFEKSIVIPANAPLAQLSGVVKTAYFAMLAVHIILSIVAVPVVLHAVVLAATHRPSELSETAHPRVGRLAVAAWALSLSLGIVTYLLLNHVYAWEVRALVPLLVTGFGRGRRTAVGGSP
ncbi:MAG: DUF420 domain-containing protein [Halobacteriaceae archaeon]